ncbi:cell surface A33 antigen isoform X1 [Anolis carolinensis]|uniref:Glycoprotein A33 n=1 Tax=Anolis carolinensis TaxID=28377 RepID=A0A803T1X6_ANOCA|nr:PREDICTED: cell surface A33 antigen isoform X1 [Anolis carolinensis]|eukprot:XP_008105917.1 PREDICTED: cell surface A33 antigen isoform X1 [Anolis carolinensis]
MEHINEYIHKQKNAAEFIVAVVHALTVETPQPKVEAARGKNATLNCIFRAATTSPQAGDFVSWQRVHDTEEFASKQLIGDSEYKGDNYKNRLTFSGNVNNGNVSITLTQLTTNDNGSYQCTVRLAGELPAKSVEIKLVVLVSPSKPVCTVVGKAEYGQNINLTCNSVEGFPQPQYSWQSFDAQNQSRPLGGTQFPGGTLMLKNISVDTVGYYICVSKNSIGQESCNISLAVVAPSMNFALIGGIIGGLVAVVIIVIIVAYFCCCKKSKDKDYELTETENRYQPPNVPTIIRGPSEEEIQREEEGENENHTLQMPPARRPSVESSEAVA